MQILWAKARSNELTRLTTSRSACCARQGIPQECFGYCTLHGIVTGAHNSPRSCLEHISTLTECLTDGRNHMPCCEEQGIPKTCRSVCVGDYSLQTITEHYKCMDYTMQTLACISSGIGTYSCGLVRVRLIDEYALTNCINLVPPIENCCINVAYTVEMIRKLFYGR